MGRILLDLLLEDEAEAALRVKIRRCYDVWNRMGQGLGSALLEQVYGRHPSFVKCRMMTWYWAFCVEDVRKNRIVWSPKLGMFGWKHDKMNSAPD